MNHKIKEKKCKFGLFLTGGGFLGFRCAVHGTTRRDLIRKDCAKEVKKILEKLEKKWFK